MIPVVLAAEPPDFDAKVRRPGLQAVAELSGKKPNPPRRAGRPFEKVASRPEDVPPDRFPPYWRESQDDLLAAYDRICAYSCFRIHEVTGGESTDHFAPKSRAWGQVYEWSNYRLACTRLNSRKNDYGDVLDPFDVADDWFALEFFGFQVVPGENLDAAACDAVTSTIDRLRLNDDSFIKVRRRHVEWYDRGVPFDILTELSPFVARELLRQGRVRPSDRATTATTTDDAAPVAKNSKRPRR